LYYEGVFPPRPRYFNVFQWISIILASIAALLGLGYIILGAIIFLTNYQMEAQALACMYFLYGSLAAYFGVKDFITILQSFRNKSKSTYSNEN